MGYYSNQDAELNDFDPRANDEPGPDDISPVSTGTSYESAITLEEEAEAFFNSMAIDDAELELAALERENPLDGATRREVDEWCLANELKSFAQNYGDDAARLVVLRVSVELEQGKRGDAKVA